MRRLRLLAVLTIAASAPACTTLATYPDWVGGGLAVSAPIREAEEDEAQERERQRIARQPKQIGARHILIMHKGSKARPEDLTRSREEAKKLAQEALLKIRSGAKFEDMVAEYSDEPGAAERGGDLGVFERHIMVKAFADAAFSLRVGEISELVESPFGFHIIKRTE
ncbi:MAG TPA: peptidylprolyl isomerase [Candidatus Nanopelagicales bacterium]|nr:peptidylprolyl isomerase [Candidatus Nanopelagicales bacterium]